MSGLLFLQLLLHVAQTGGNIDFGADNRVTYQHNGGAVGVVERQNAHSLLGEIDVGNNIRHYRENIVLGKHNALTLAGGAGGEYQQGHLVCINGRVKICLGCLGKLFFSRSNQRGKRSFRIFCLQENGGSRERHFCGDRIRFFRDLLFAEQILDTCCLGGFRQILREPIPIQRYQNRADGLGGKVYQCPLAAGFADQSAVLPGASHSQHFTGEGTHVIAELHEGDLFRFLGSIAVGEIYLFSVHFGGFFHQIPHILEFEFFV